MQSTRAQASSPLTRSLDFCLAAEIWAAFGWQDKQFVALFTTGQEKDWPDSIDLNTGQFTYYGDNRTPGHELHKTPGNRVLRRVFDLLHGSPSQRELIPPFFVFQRYPTQESARAVQFKGLSVPGHPSLSATEDLVAVWKTSGGRRFQNYRSIFTILDLAVLERTRLRSFIAGQAARSSDAPEVWNQWVQTGKYRPLTSEPTTVIRTMAEQMPDTENKIAILRAVYQHFKDSPHQFEGFPARIFQMHDRRVIIDRITRASIDGARDAIGRYVLGLNEDPVYVDFALEAKCYSPRIGGGEANTVGVKEISRLISRLRHRQFGVLVTTSAIARQGYEEVREDGHPIVFIAGRDITEILIQNGHNSPESVKGWLSAEFHII